MAYDTDLIANLQGVLQDKKDIKSAIAAKGVTVPDAARLGDLPALVQQIQTESGGAELPTLTNPATASDIVSGKQAIDGGGSLLTGTGDYLPIKSTIISSIINMDYTVSETGGYYKKGATYFNPIKGTGLVMRDSSGARMTKTAIDALTDIASPSDIAAGKQAWGQDGCLMTGTCTPAEAGYKVETMTLTAWGTYTLPVSPDYVVLTWHKKGSAAANYQYHINTFFKNGDGDTNVVHATTSDKNTAASIVCTGSLSGNTLSIPGTTAYFDSTNPATLTMFYKG